MTSPGWPGPDSARSCRTDGSASTRASGISPTGGGSSCGTRRRTCERLGLRIVLYDEASYPSGSANGAVVAENPEFAARCLVRAEQVVEVAPGEVRYARPSLGRGLWDRRIATVVLDAGGPQRVEPDAHGLVRLDRPGTHRVVAVFDVPSGGTIRGAHAFQDDGSPLAPAASDLMNPEAVAAFRRLTHDAYAEHLGPWFGTTVVGLFTDEPSVGGRDPRTDSFPWTPGLEDDLADLSGPAVEQSTDRLALLWEPDGDPCAACSPRRCRVASRRCTTGPIGAGATPRPRAHRPPASGRRTPGPRRVRLARPGHHLALGPAGQYRLARRPERRTRGARAARACCGEHRAASPRCSGPTAGH